MRGASNSIFVRLGIVAAHEVLGGDAVMLGAGALRRVQSATLGRERTARPRASLNDHALLCAGSPRERTRLVVAEQVSAILRLYIKNEILHPVVTVHQMSPIEPTNDA